MKSVDEKTASLAYQIAKSGEELAMWIVGEADFVGNARASQVLIPTRLWVQTMRPPGTALGFGLISGAGSRRVTEPKPPNFIRKKNKNKKKETKTQRGEKSSSPRLCPPSRRFLISFSPSNLPPLCRFRVSALQLLPNSGPRFARSRPPMVSGVAHRPDDDGGRAARRSSARRSRPARGRPWPRRRPRRSAIRFDERRERGLPVQPQRAACPRSRRHGGGGGGGLYSD